MEETYTIEQLNALRNDVLAVLDGQSADCMRFVILSILAALVEEESATLAEAQDYIARVSDYLISNATTVIAERPRHA